MVGENLSYNGKRHKTAVTKEYYDLLNQIWTLYLSAFNKTVTYNVF